MRGVCHKHNRVRGYNLCVDVDPPILLLLFHSEADPPNYKHNVLSLMYNLRTLETVEFTKVVRGHGRMER